MQSSVVIREYGRNKYASGNAKLRVALGDTEELGSGEVAERLLAHQPKVMSRGLIIGGRKSAFHPLRTHRAFAMLP
jgi:hypothetical protein